jgi:hypothetical protein
MNQKRIKDLEYLTMKAMKFIYEYHDDNYEIHDIILAIIVAIKNLPSTERIPIDRERIDMMMRECPRVNNKH